MEKYNGYLERVTKPKGENCRIERRVKPYPRNWYINNERMWITTRVKVKLIDRGP